jgi:putative pyruvate formate lyase activating enzyme
MPDLKFLDPAAAKQYMNAEDYPQVACDALREMHRQVGVLELDSTGLARRGVLVRHLVMPGHLEDTRRVMRFLAREISPDTFVNVMAQYHPAGHARRYPPLDRPLSLAEYREALRIAREEGLHRFARD